MARRRKKKPDAELPLDTTFGIPAGLIPKNPRHRRLCELIAEGKPVFTAAIEAGFARATANRTAYELAERYEDYIKWLAAHHAQAKAKQIAIELEPVLQEIAKIAFVNEYDYLVFEPGDPPKVRRKRLDELTREEMTAIEVFKRKTKDGYELDYKLRDKEGRLIDLVKHLGGFSEKIILEHRHRHLHAHLDLTDVPIEQLEAIERNMQQLLKGRTRGNALEVK
jgi:hypothetical protein